MKESIEIICGTVLVAIVLLCFTKCAIEENRLEWEKEKAKQTQKP